MSGVPDDEFSKFIAASGAGGASRSHRDGDNAYKARLLPFDEDAGRGSQSPLPKVSFTYSSGPRPFVRMSLQFATILTAGLVGWYSASGAVTSPDASGRYVTSEALEALTANLAAKETAARQHAAAASEKQAGDLAALRRLVEAVARNVDGLRAARQQPSAEEVDRETAQKVAQLVERLDRLEQQASAQAPTASIPHQAEAPAAIRQPVRPAPVAGRKPQRPPPAGANAVREVYDRGAVVHGHRANVNGWPDSVSPGAGRMQTILRRNGQWVVTTTDGEMDFEGY